MINKETLAALVGGVFKNKPGAFDKRMIHPVRDWFMGVTFFLLVVIAGGVYSAFLFVEYRNIATDKNASQDPVVQYNEVLVNNMITQYEMRRSSYVALKSSFVPEAVRDVSSVTEATVSSSTHATSTEEGDITEEGDDMEGGAVIAN